MILDGKKVARELLDQLQQQIKEKKLHKKLAIILVGDNPASLLYTSMKRKKAQEIGMEAEIHHFASTISEEELCLQIRSLQMTVDGILVQLPLPPELNTEVVLNTISPEKDADGLTAASLGKLFQKDERYAPATPLAIIRLLEAYHLPLSGKEVVIVNRSALIGKPLALLFLHRGATVTVCHSQTRELSSYTLRADILVSAVGKPRFITAEMVKPGAIVIDAGIAQEGNGVVGDVDFSSVEKKVSYITPVPGGVGPVTVAQLLANVVNIS